MANPNATAGAAAQVFALFRSILRTHRIKLPPPMRAMGDRYVREEFKAHLRPDANTTQDQWKTFFNEWIRYRGMLLGAADLAPDGVTVLDGGEAFVAGVDRAGDISAEALAAMSPDQVARLQKMREEAMRLGRELMAEKEKPQPSS
jgi:hypothetical protein